MTIRDPLIHPALLDPRNWGDVDLYDAAINVDREPLAGDERHAPDRSFTIRHLKLDLRFDDEKQQVSGAATLTIEPINDGLDHF